MYSELASIYSQMETWNFHLVFKVSWLGWQDTSVFFRGFPQEWETIFFSVQTTNKTSVQFLLQ